MAAQLASGDALAVALRKQDAGRFISLCKKLDSNVIISLYGVERSVAHHLASAHFPNCIKCFKALIKKLGAACLTQRDDNSDTPVHLAALHQNPAWLQLIKKKLGSDCFHQPGAFQRTAIHMAAMNQNNNLCLKWFVKEYGVRCLSIRDQRGNTPVHLAAWKQGAESIQFIKSVIGSDCFHHPGRLQRTVIHTAAMNENNNSCLKWLVKECGAQCLTVRDEEGNTPVHLAALKQDADTMQFIKSVVGYDCFFQPGQLQRTAIHAAAMNRHNNSCLKWLVKKCGAQCLSARDRHGDTPVHLAACFQSADSMKFIKSVIGSDCFHQPGFAQRTAVHMAAMNENSSSCIKYLVSHLRSKFLLDKDSSGATPVHFSAQYQDLETVLPFLQSIGDGALDLQDANGKTIADYAKQNAAHGDSIRQWIAQQLQQRQSAHKTTINRRPHTPQRTMLGAQLRQEGQQPDSSAAKSSLHADFSSWDFLLDEEGKKQLVGSGGFGKVYKALTDRLQTVAVKIVKLEGGGDVRLLDKAIEQENAEISVLRSISHPNIVMFLKSERRDGRKLCIFTELIPGHSLFELMQRKRKPFDEAAVKRLSKQICSALNFLHSRKPVTLHRDIKCSNIMLTHEGVIKLIDFGLAKEVLATMCSTKKECGTAYFMAPELYNEDGRIVYSPKTDVWAFGCTVYEMLAMRPPNAELAWQQVPQRIRKHEMPHLPAGASDSLRDFYRSCVEREPRRRADTKELLEHRFLRSP